MNRPPHEIPDAAEFARLRSFLSRHGCTPAKIDQAAGSAVENRSRHAIAVQLCEWLKEQRPALSSQRSAKSQSQKADC